jgi:hypothetical protein
MIKEICKKCKKLISGEPEWHYDVKEGDILQSWWYSDYSINPLDRKWHMRTDENQKEVIVKVDEKLVYIRNIESDRVEIRLKSHFKKGYTLFINKQK